jgi:hypothetical protein
MKIFFLKTISFLIQLGRVSDFHIFLIRFSYLLSKIHIKKKKKKITYFKANVNLIY